MYNEYNQTSLWIFSYSNYGQAKISKSHLKQEKYSISSGIAIVINNETFERSLKLPDRIGSSSDAASLFQSFQEHGFENALLTDASFEEMKEKFEESKTKKCIIFECPVKKRVNKYVGLK